MKWLVQQDGKTSSYDAFSLISFFMSVKKTTEEQKELATTLLNRLSYSQAITTMSLLELLTLGVFIGYHYRLFKEKNKPTIEVASERDTKANS